MKLSSFGHQLVSGQPQAWAELLKRPVQQVTRARPAYKGSSSRLRRLDIEPVGDGRLAVLVKFTDGYETRVYRDLAAHIPLDLPRVYYAEESGAEGVCILQALPPGKPVTAWNEQDEQNVLGDLARLHARFWNAPPLDKFSWLYPFEDELNAQLDKAVRGLALLKQIGGWPGLITSNILGLMECLLADRPRLLAPLADLPPTLIHCDAWQPNWVLFDDRRVLLDWQSAACGPAVWDVVYFLEMSGEAGGRLRLADTEALQIYLDALERERRQADVAHRAAFLQVVPAVSVVNTLARWTAYAFDYLRPMERLPILARAWTGLPRGLRQRIETRLAWTDVEYYRRTFARFEERARIVYGV